MEEYLTGFNLHHTAQNSFMRPGTEKVNQIKTYNMLALGTARALRPQTSGVGLKKYKEICYVLEDEEGLANMRHLGKCIDWLGKAIIPTIDNYPKS
ncbi:MAG: hypothetical protein MRK01_14365 [Candidatus Scalindua sp.]|nr:hypothetical protein [Candidatus Scalindua sp.]